MTPFASFCPRAPLLVLLGASVGCGKVAGLDEFSVGEPRVTNPCSETEVPSGDPAQLCVRVGVEKCPQGAALERGGCQAALPETPCASGRIEQNGCGAPRLACSVDPRPADVPPAAVEYVDREYAGLLPSDGSQGAPWKTIREALAHVEPSGAVLIGKGDYFENVVLRNAGVALMGTCADETRVHGDGERVGDGEDYPCGFPGDRKAAICVASDASGARVGNLTATGAYDGIAVIGATNVVLLFASVVDTGRYAIRIEERDRNDAQPPLPASVTLTRPTLVRARGAGLYIAGAKVTSENLTVDGVEPLNGYLGYGVSVRAGGTQTANPTRSVVRLVGSVIVNAADAALHVAGAEVVVSDAFLGNPEFVEPRGRGVLVEREIPRGTPTELTLDQVLVERVRDAAIEVRSAKVTLENVTLRPALTVSDDGCAGQGLRVNSNRVSRAEVTIRHSLIEGSRQAAIHATDALVNVDRAILRDSTAGGARAACADHIGDAATIESGRRDTETELVLDHARLDRSARAAIASFGGRVTVKSPSVLGCNTRFAAVARHAQGMEIGNAICGCGSSWRRCSFAVDENLEPWLSPGRGSGWAGSTQDWTVGLLEFTFAIPKKLGDGSVAWVLDAPEVPAVWHDPADPDGCLPLPGVPMLPGQRVGAWREPDEQAGESLGTMAALYQVLQSTKCEPPLMTTPQTGPLSQAPYFVSNAPMDFNRGAIWANVALGEVEEYEQAPESGSPWTSGGEGWRIRGNVEPGWHSFSMPGRSCSAAYSGVPDPDRPGAVRLLVEPGVINNLGVTCQ